MRSRNVKKIHTVGDFKIKGTTLIRYVGKSSHVVVPSYIKCLAPHAFYENNNIKSVVLPRHAEYALGTFYERGLLPDSTMEKALEW